MFSSRLGFSAVARRAAVSVAYCVAVLASAHADDLKGRSVGGLSEADIDRLAARALETFSIPGMSVGIIQNGQVRHLKGYGKRDITEAVDVDPDTIFKIASNSKAFTTAALAILVDEGKVGWESRVSDLLPEFRLYDPYSSREMTVSDLLTHRSGLGLGAGDLMLWPEPNSFSREDIVRNLRHLKPASSFRSRYAYDNTLYVVAGEVIARVSGLSYEDFIDRRIMKPLGLDACFAGAITRKAMRNVAKPHGVIDGEITVIERALISNEPIASTAAGGLRCSARDMLVWMETQLNQGLAPNGERLFSDEQSREMWKPHTILPVSEADYAFDQTHFKAYGLGWRLSDAYGYKQVSHTGTLAGMLSYVTLVPELDLGVVVLTNGASNHARQAMMRSLVHGFMGAPAKDWVAFYDNRNQNNNDGLAEPGCGEGVPPDALTVAGDYVDPWFGQITITKIGETLTFESEKSLRLTGAMTFCRHPNIYIVRWSDRTLASGDAYIMLETDFLGRVTGLRMARIDPAADFSFDFQDLGFVRAQERSD